jgi:hypothetical protein
MMGAPVVRLCVLARDDQHLDVVDRERHALPRDHRQHSGRASPWTRNISRKYARMHSRRSSGSASTIARSSGRARSSAAVRSHGLGIEVVRSTSLVASGEIWSGGGTGAAAFSRSNASWLARTCSVYRTCSSSQPRSCRAAPTSTASSSRSSPTAMIGSDRWVPMASVWIRARPTKDGGKRYRVEFRLGGREARIRYGGRSPRSARRRFAPAGSQASWPHNASRSSAFPPSRSPRQRCARQRVAGRKAASMSPRTRGSSTEAPFGCSSLCSATGVSTRSLPRTSPTSSARLLRRARRERLSARACSLSG